MEPYAPPLLARLPHWPRSNRQRFRGASHTTRRANRHITLIYCNTFDPLCVLYEGEGVWAVGRRPTAHTPSPSYRTHKGSKVLQYINVICRLARRVVCDAPRNRWRFERGQWGRRARRGGAYGSIRPAVERRAS